jgi:SNF2 family DNA or RNA helicase
MSKMRKITGISKVEACVDLVTEFLISCDRKIVVFVHHQNAAAMLKANLDSWLKDGGFKPCLDLNSSLSADDRQNLVVKFRDEDYRVLIASTLASGEGLNLQFCSDAIMLERQWNPANEEQAEGRFHRFGQVNPVSVIYMIESETIDEYFTELVEQKRAIVSSTLDNKELQWDSNSLMQELALVLTTKGKKAWKL